MKVITIIVILNFFSVFKILSDTSDTLLVGTVPHLEAKQLEKKLVDQPENIEIREKLVNYYSRYKLRDKRYKDSMFKHVEWLIKNYPESYVLKNKLIFFDISENSETYIKYKNLWQDLVDKDPDNLKILKNAQSFLYNDRDYTIKILKHAKSIDPTNPQWSYELGHIYKLETINDSISYRKEYAIKAYVEFELTFNLLKQAEPNPRDLNLLDNMFDVISVDDLIYQIAIVSYIAGDLKNSKKYAKKLLIEYADIESIRNYYHIAHIILGEIAFQRKQFKLAKKHLLEAGNTYSTSMVEIEGPDFSLADKLFSIEEKEVVIEYLKLCLKFWDSGQEDLNKMLTIINNDETPVFPASNIF